MLRDFWIINNFSFIFNNMTKYLWKDGIHLQDLDMSILSKNFTEIVNNYLFSDFDNCF